ncbi:MAG TPA: hypothetical protein VKB18_10560 [Gemmatimonadota bacterium]|nr:hypothetical protein [Gemmatimonadota bacterium]
MSKETGGGDPGDGPQLQIWDTASRRQSLGRLPVGDEEWEVHIVVETVAPDLARGRIVFERAGRQLATAPVIVEESEEAVVSRAESMPRSMVRQLLVSVRD